MSNYYTCINGKSVRRGSPVSIPRYDIIGREHETKKVLASWGARRNSLPMSPLLIGKPGVGKNKIAELCCEYCMKDLYILQGHEDITAEDMVCTVRISDDRERQVEYILSPLVSAMETGGVCMIDEIGKIRARALAPLASLLDERRYIDSTLLGERFFAHQAFRLIAATNSSDMDQNRLPDFIRSRLRPVITIDNPERKELEAIIISRFSSQNNGDCTELIDEFWHLWFEQHQDTPPTPRDSLLIFGYAWKLADFEAYENERPYFIGDRGSDIQITPEHIRKAFFVFHETAKRGDS